MCISYIVDMSCAWYVVPVMVAILCFFSDLSYGLNPVIFVDKLCCVLRVIMLSVYEIAYIIKNTVSMLCHCSL